MPTLSKETKISASMLEMQLSTEQRVFVAETYYNTSSYLEKRGFPQKIFRERPTNKQRTRRDKSNIYWGRSGRRTVRTEETIEVVRFSVENSARNLSCTRNGLRLSSSTFNKIVFILSQRHVQDHVKHLRWKFILENS